MFFNYIKMFYIKISRHKFHDILLLDLLERIIIFIYISRKII